MKLRKFTHSKDSKTIQRMWNANADPIHDFATNYIVDSDNYKTKRETYHFYKEVMLSKGETSMGIGQFGKAFSEYFEESRETDENGRKVRVWQNIAFKIPKQMELNDFDSR